MYNYNFKNENIIFEKHNCFAEINGKELFINILITEKNLLLFYNVTSDFVNMKSNGVTFTPNYELIVKLNLADIDYVCENNNTYISNSSIIIYDFNLSNNI